MPREISDNIVWELELGQIQKVTTLPPAYILSPLGAVQEKLYGQFESWRWIHDLPNESVNDGIPSEFGSLSYQTLDNAIAIIARRGRFTVLQKRDLKDAFRKIPVSPYDHWLLLFEWDGQIYSDLRLPFGLSTAPFIFNY